MFGLRLGLLGALARRPSVNPHPGSDLLLESGDLLLLESGDSILLEQQ